MAIKPSQVSPCSSKSLATQDTPVRILTSSNDIYVSDTSSLFHEGTVSSSVQPSAFPSSSVQMAGKARKCLFSKLQASLQSIFQCNSFKCRFTTFQFKFGFYAVDRWNLVPRIQKASLHSRNTPNLSLVYLWCGRTFGRCTVMWLPYNLSPNYPGPLDLSCPGENLVLLKICRNIALKLALSVQINKQAKKQTNKTKQKMEVGRNKNVVLVFCPIAHV